MTTGSPQPPLSEADRVKGLYLVFANECTGIRPVEALTLARSYHLALFLQRWTADDLRITLRYLRKKFYRKDKPEILRGMMHFRKLFGDPSFEFFEEYWLDAKADQRNTRPAPTQRTQVLAATGRQEHPERNGECKTPGSVLKAGYENLWKQLE